MALSRDVVIRMLGDSESAVRAQQAAARAAEVTVQQYRRAEREFDRQQRAQETASRKQREAMTSVGQGALAFGATMGVGIGMAVKAAMSWESAWAGVRKTVSGTPAELGRLEKGLRGLARELPATHEEIAAVAEAAGQLGVQTDSIVDFTRTMVNLGETTNLSADQAATSLAQMMNVMQTAPEDVDRLGSTLVALGNAGASTEADIMDMATRLTGVGRLIGASEADVLALANAMSSMGIQAELGGGAMSRVMQTIYSAVQTGGDAVQGFADVAGMSAEQFATAFRDDPIRAVDAFVQGLNTVEQSGGNVITTLGDLGISGTQNLQVMLQLKGAGDLLTDSLDMGSDAWEQNTALVIEAAKRYDTTASKVEIARNNINDAGIEIGEVFLPVLADLAEGVADVAGWFADLPDGVKALIGGFGGLAAVVGVSGGAFLLMAPRVVETYRAVHTLAETSPRAASALGKLGKAAGVAAAVAALGTAIGALQDSLAPTELSMEGATTALLDMGDSTAMLDERFRALGTVDDSIDGVKGAAERLTDPSLLDRFNDFGGSLQNIASFGTVGSDEGAMSRAAILKDFNALGESLALMVQNGNAELAARQFEVLKEQWVAGGGTVEQLLEVMPAYQEALDGADNEQRAAAESARQQAEQASLLAQNLEATYGSIEGYAAAMGLSEEQTQDLVEATETLAETLAGFVDPLKAYTQYMADKEAAEQRTAQATAEKTGDMSKSWEDYVVDTGFQFGKYMEYLRDQVKAQDDWQVNMLKLSGRVSQGTIDELERMGAEGAPLVAELVKKSDKELAEFDDITKRRTKDATGAMATQLTLAGPVLAEVAKKAGQRTADGLAEKLAAGKTTVAEIARQYGVVLAGGINPVLRALGKNEVRVVGRNSGLAGGASGRYVLADGAVFGQGAENHVAQIAQAGAWRTWAEPETGGEAYIPLSPSKRGRSVDIWRETGRRLGQFFADGGFSTPDDVPRPPSTAPFRIPISTGADAMMRKGYDEVRKWVEENAQLYGGNFGASNPSPNGIGGLGPAAAAARRFVMARWGITNIGGYSYRNIAGTNTLSDHATGHAIDVMLTPDYYSPGKRAIGKSIASWFVANPKAFGTKYVIYFDQINSGSGWQPYGHPGGFGDDTSQHRDHDHISFYKNGTSYVPQDGPAYLHRGEAVVPEAQNRAWMTAPAMRMPVAAASRTPVVVQVNFEGATISGRMVMDPSGMVTLVDARIDDALTTVIERGQYNS